jgi:tetratricopeptide (TPR) repeat protein
MKYIVLAIIFLLFRGIASAQLFSERDTSAIGELIAQSGDAVAVHNARLALQFASRADSLARLWNYREGDALRQLGTVYWYMSDASNALYYYNAAANAYSKAGTEQYTLSVRSDIAGIYYELQEYTKALVLYNEVARQSVKSKDSILIATVYRNLGSVYWQLRQPEQALRYLESARFLSETLLLHRKPHRPLERNLAATLRMLATIHQRLGQREQFVSYMHNALSRQEALNDYTGAASAYELLGRHYLETGNTTMATLCIKRGSELAKIEVNTPMLGLQLLEASIELERKKANWQQAFLLQREAYQKRDSIFQIQYQQLQTQIEEADERNRRERVGFLLQSREDSQKWQDNAMKWRYAVVFLAILLVLLTGLYLNSLRQSGKY